MRSFIRARSSAAPSPRTIRPASCRTVTSPIRRSVILIGMKMSLMCRDPIAAVESSANYTLQGGIRLRNPFIFERFSKPSDPEIRLRVEAGNGESMSFLKKLFSRNTEPRQRVRICVECGMPVAEHKDWCSILRTQREMDARAQAAAERA